MDRPVNFQTGEKQRSRGKGASVTTLSVHCRNLAMLHLGKQEGKVVELWGANTRRCAHWADAIANGGLPRVSIALLSPFPSPMLSSHPCNSFISPTPIPPHVPPPGWIPLIGTTFGLGTSPQSSSKTHVLAGQWRRQSMGMAVPIFLARDTACHVSALYIPARFHLILLGFMSLRPLLLLMDADEVTPQTQDLLVDKG